MATNVDTKRRILEALFDRPVWIRRVNATEIRTRCPFCGDSKKSENTGHLYLHIDLDNNSPIMYNCFLCNESGVLQESQLSLLDIDDSDLKNDLKTLNKTSDKIDRKGLANEIKPISFDFQLPKVQMGRKTSYIDERLGRKFSIEDYKDMKVITSLRDFIQINQIRYLPCPDQMCFMIEDYYVGFLTHGSSHILFRDITNTQSLRWIKYSIMETSNQNRVFYTIASELDLFTSDEITVVLAEGVLDVLSAKYNLGYDKSNTVHIAVSSRYYDAVILYLISIGVIGSNVTIHIFADNDEEYNKTNNKSVHTTSLGYYRHLMRLYKHLFGKILVSYNEIGKDIGVPKEQIMLKTFTL